MKSLSRVDLIVGCREGDANERATDFIVEVGLRALEDGEIDAFVHDRPILRYHVNREHGATIRMLEAQFNLTSYAIAMPSDSPLVAPVDRELLRITREQSWEEAISAYSTRLAE